MNYLLQLVAFRKRRMADPITANAICLWYILHEYANQIGFPETFTCTNTALQSLAGMGPMTLYRARQSLCRGGYILYRNGTRDTCGTYRLTDLTADYRQVKQSDIQTDIQTDMQTDIQSDIQTDMQTDTDPVTLPKQDLNKTKHKNKKGSPPRCKETDELFGDFWKAYPKKQAKSEALKAFAALAPDRELTDRMVASLALAVLTQNWREDGGRFIPNPATWLRGKRWEDESLPQKEPFAFSDGKGGCPY